MLVRLSGTSADAAHNAAMSNVRTRFKTGAPRHFIREWRKHRRLTLEQLAERIEVTHGAISQLARGVINYTKPMLEAIADALNCSPGDLITVDPLHPSEAWSIVETLEALPAEQRANVISIIEGLRKAS